MRRISSNLFMLFTTFLALCNIVFAQGWYSLQSGTSSNLFSVHFPNSNTGYAAGAGGIVLKTTNDGNNWLNVSTSSNYTHLSVFFIDANTGFVAGYYAGASIRNRPCAGMRQYEHYNAAHELGHTFGLMDDNDGRHAGQYQSVCLMYSERPLCNPNDPVVSSFAICDTHTCDIYRNAVLIQPLLGYAQGNDKNSNNLDFNLSLEKYRFVEGETIIVKLTVTNKGNTIDSVSRSNFKYFFNFLKLTNNKSSGFHSMKAWLHFAPEPYHTLNPSESIYIEIELQDYYGTSLIETGPYNHYYLTEANYTLQYKSGDDVLNRRYQSNITSFEVKNLKGIMLISLKNC